MSLISSALHRALSNLGMHPNQVTELENLQVARGVASVTGSGDVTTGLAMVVAVVVSLQDDPSLNANLASATVGDQSSAPAAGKIRVKVWKPTGSGDCTPIAATAAKNVNWMAIGTAF